jgi:uncharacterized protein (DUF2062 family)
MRKPHWEGFSWHKWTVFFGGVGKAMLLGGTVCSSPFAIASYFISRAVVTRHQRKKLEQEKRQIEAEENPS